MSAQPRRVDAEGWLAAADAALASGCRLVALWGAEMTFSGVFQA